MQVKASEGPSGPLGARTEKEVSKVRVYTHTHIFGEQRLVSFCSWLYPQALEHIAEHTVDA